MNKKKKKKHQISPYIEPHDVADIAEQTGNVYRSLIVISERANQIAGKLKDELHTKLNEFASTTDSLEEVHENKEQIEISKYYERMPHPTLLALEEFYAHKLESRFATPEEVEQIDKAKKERKNRGRRR